MIYDIGIAQKTEEGILKINNRLNGIRDKKLHWFSKY